MKRRVLSLAFIAIAAMGIMAMAGSPKASTDKAKTEKCTKGKKCDKGPQGCDSMRRAEFDPFVGITLTDDQKAKLEAMRPEAQKCPCCGAEKKCEAGQKKCEPGKCDSVGRPERPDPRQAKRDYLAKIKEILTPEQYVVFLENAVVSQRDDQGRQGRPGEGRPGEGGPEQGGPAPCPGEGRPGPCPGEQPCH